SLLATEISLMRSCFRLGSENTLNPLLLRLRRRKPPCGSGARASEWWSTRVRASWPGWRHGRESNQLVLVGEDNSGKLGVDIELAEDVLDVIPHGHGRD